MAAKDSVGRFGEQLAARHLVAQGWALLDRNWRCDLGEVDIVARDGDCLVICEVKTRRSQVCGHPAEAVDYRKLRRLRQLAARWLLEADLTPSAVRIDVISVICQQSGSAQVEHLRAVI